MRCYETVRFLKHYVSIYLQKFSGVCVCVFLENNKM